VADSFNICRESQLIVDDTTETENFCRMFNKFFDCLNTRKLEEATEKRNENLACYSSGDDPRLKVCKFFCMMVNNQHMLVVKKGFPWIFG
jgi:hypothetical protein